MFVIALFFHLLAMLAFLLRNVPQIPQGGFPTAVEFNQGSAKQASQIVSSL